MNMKKIVVLGGSGFVGAHVCENLVRDGWHITVLTRRRHHARSVVHLPGLVVIECDVYNAHALNRVVAGHDALVNLVGILHGSQADFQRAHVGLAQRVAIACTMGGVKRVVHVSALGVDEGQPDAAPSVYLRSKGEGEAVLIQAATGALSLTRDVFGLTVIRPSLIFGPEDRSINLFAKAQRIFPVILLANSHARFQPVWVQDVAQAVVRSLAGASVASSPRVLEACGPDVFTLRELVRLSGAASGCESLVIDVPEWLGRLQTAVMQLAPGRPWLSLDAMDSMQRDSVATGQHPGLSSLGILASALPSIAQDYLG